MKHQTLSLQLCGQPTDLTLTQWKLHDRVYRSHVTSTSSRLIEKWEHIHQVVIDEVVMQWHPRLGACVRLRAHGGHFEHRLAVLKSCYSHGRTLDSQSRLCL